MDNTEKKLEEVLKRLEEIENLLDPPLYRKVLRWCARHFILIIVITVLAYFSWKTWVIIDHLLVSFEALKAEIVENTTTFQDQIKSLAAKLESLKFWK